MDTIIQKFVSLPPHIKNTLSSAEVIGRLEKIEQRFQLSLAEIVMRVAVKDIPLSELESQFQSLFGVSYEQAKQLKEDLIQNVFSTVGSHLGIKTQGAPMLSRDPQEQSLGVDQRDAEISHHQNRLQYTEQPNSTYDAEIVVKNIESSAGKQLDHVLHKRLLRLVESRLVDARTKLDVREYLVRPEKIGGMGFSETVAERVLPLIEQEWKKVHDLHLNVKREEASPRIAKTRNQSSYPFHPPLASQHVERPIQKSVPAQAPLEKKSSEAVLRPSFPAVPKKPPTFQIGKVQSMPQAMEALTEKSAPVTPTPPPLPQTPPVPTPPMPQPPFQSKPEQKPMPKIHRNPVVENEATMHDIKRPRKLVGPVEELEQMSIQDFRNLGESLEESGKRIQEKIRHLERESFELRSQGVKAWRKSPLMQEYLSIGRESMEQGKSIRDIIQSHRTSGETTMSEGEFETIGALNHAIRY